VTSAAAGQGVPGGQGVRRGRAKPFVFGALVLAGIALFTALGIWQLERRSWKLDLIRSVDERIHAPPVAAPGPAAWPEIDAAKDAYRRVEASGHFIAEKPALVQAVTVRGPGFWVVAPFAADTGFTVLVNRGFVAAEDADTLPPAPGGNTTITGLLRISEPGGGFLRSNDPAADRWYSRDVAAIAATRGLSAVAPYFIDAEASAASAPDMPVGGPVGGLTVVSFRNHHLLYALTWFGLAAMLVVWAAVLVRQGRRPPPNDEPWRRPPPDGEARP
jgi:surfeit locus 1 family protein